jgi:hypothetical protein
MLPFTNAQPDLDLKVRPRRRFSYGSRAHSVRHLRDSNTYLVFNPTNETIGELRHDQSDDAELFEAMER